jgi:hypothetical protein
MIPAPCGGNGQKWRSLIDCHDEEVWLEIVEEGFRNAAIGGDEVRSP